MTSRLAELRDRLAAIPESAQRLPAVPESVPRILAAFIAGLALLVFVIWGLTGAGYFWPAWVWLGLGGPLAMMIAVRATLTAPPGPRRRLEVQAVASIVLIVYVSITWALAGGGYSGRSGRCSASPSCSACTCSTSSPAATT